MPIARGCRLLLIAVFALVAGALFAAEDTTRQTLDQVKSSLADIDSTLKMDTLSDSDLARLRGENDPLGVRLQAVIADLTPRLEASRKRLVELTPKSKDAAPANDAASDELKSEQAKHDALDAELRSARAMLLQVDDNASRISLTRRDLFARQTFARSSSVVSPLLWATLAREAPTDAKELGALFGDWMRGVRQRLSLSQELGFGALLLALILSAAPMRWVARRVIARDPAVREPSRLRRAVAALWTAGVLAALPLAALGVLAYALDAFDISDPRLQGIVDAVFDGLRLIALAHALARGLLAPGQENWRLVSLGDRVSRLLFRLVIFVATIWAVQRLAEPIADQVASLSVTIAARAVGATLAALATAHTLRRIAAPIKEMPVARDPWAPARTLAWAVTVVTFGSALFGYIAFATFLVNQTLFVVAVASALYILDAIVQESAEMFLQPDAAIGHGLMTTIGLRRETLLQVVVVLQGIARLAALITAVVVAIGPLGLPSQDFAATLRAAYFGFTVGGMTLSVSSLVAAAVVFGICVVATRGAQNWLSERYLPRTRLDAGVSNSIRTITGYVGVVIALVIGGSRLGLDLQKFAIVAGALSVGIGFGLQTIVNNFVSGLILLWERSIRVGDWVVIGAEQGFVRSINARSTEIETFDRAMLIVPNSSLVTGQVKNWMHTDRVARIVVSLNVRFDADPEAVRELLIGAAKAQEQVLSIPAPIVLFNEIGDWALKFQLLCFVDDALMAERVRSEVHFDMLKRLREANLSLPYPFPVANTPI